MVNFDWILSSYQTGKVSESGILRTMTVGELIKSSMAVDAAKAEVADVIAKIVEHPMGVIISRRTEDERVDYKHAIKLAESSNKNKNLNTQLYAVNEGTHHSTIDGSESTDAQKSFIQQVQRFKASRYEQPLNRCHTLR